MNSRPLQLRIDSRLVCSPTATAQCQGERVFTRLRGPGVSSGWAGGTMGPLGPVEVSLGGVDFGSPLNPLSVSGRGFSWAAWHSVWPGSGPEQPACLPLPASLPWDQRQSWDKARHSMLSVYLSIFPLHSFFFFSIIRRWSCPIFLRFFFPISFTCMLSFIFFLYIWFHPSHSCYVCHLLVLFILPSHYIYIAPNLL